MDTGNQIKDKHNIKTRDKLLVHASIGEGKHINMEEKRTNKNGDEENAQRK
jgi:hypothetical protein